nr:zinc finger protein ZAT5-like [Setaria viridis]
MRAISEHPCPFCLSLPSLLPLPQRCARRRRARDPLMATPPAYIAGAHKQRAKRRRQCSSLPSPASSSSSHSGSTTTQQEEEDEAADMAKCLILLAQGPAATVMEPAMPVPVPAPPRPTTTQRPPSSYECKTCNKCFPSFQALGGHRTSHNNDKIKKPRRPEAEAAAAAAVTTTLSLRTAAVAGRPAAAHECSACGATFASGQALGGHMRRHRPLTAGAAPESVVTAEETSAGGNNVSLELDLNLLPAPSTEQEVTSPALATKRTHHFN